MSCTLDVLAQLVFKDGDGENRKTVSRSDVTVVEQSQQTMKLGFTTATETVQVALGGAASDKKRWLFVRSDRIVKMDFVTLHASTDLTEYPGFGSEIAANGFYLCNLTGGVTTVWLTNRAASTATVEVKMFATTST